MNHDKKEFIRKTKPVESSKTHSMPFLHRGAYQFPSSASEQIKYNHDYQPSERDGESSNTANPIETIQVSQEAPWDKQGEDILRHWLAITEQQAAAHRRKGFKLKKLYRIFGILSILSASIVFLFSNIKLSIDDSCGNSVVKSVIAFLNLVIINVQFSRFWSQI